MGDFDLTIGVVLLGNFINTYLFGLVCYQFAVYYNSKFDDELWIRVTVGSLLFLDIVHSIVSVDHAWDLCVTNYMNPAQLADITWHIPFTACATAVAAFITQIFLGLRVHKLTKSTALFIGILILAFLGLLFGFIAGIKSGLLKHVVLFAELKPFVICWLTFQTATDLLITGVLSVSLTRSRTGFRSTNTVLNRLIRGAVQTGLFASLFALGDLFSFVLFNQTYLYALFAYPLGRIYSNTLLDTLNSRKSLKDLMSNTNSNTDVELQSGFRFATTGSKTTAGSITLSGIKVNRDVETTHDMDEAKTSDLKYDSTVV